ncbi:MAG: outer membrane protein assembly factor BamE [Pseudomonadota bacterium]
MLALTGCTSDNVIRLLDEADLFYQPTIIQGDRLSAEQLEILRPGMTRHQVRQLLGTPQLQDHFHAERWDYVYSLGAGSQPQTIRRITLHFEQDILVRISGDTGNHAPDNTAAPGMIAIPDRPE